MKSVYHALTLLGLSFLVTGCLHNGSTDGVHQSATTAAVVIGVENSQMFGKCDGSINDSKRMYKLLSAYTANIKLLQNGNATYDNVSSAISDAIESSSLCIIYYSGHGGSQAFSDTGSEEMDGKDEYLCLYDTYMRDNDIWDLISGSQGRVVLIFDCCCSQTMFNMARVAARKQKRDSLGFSMICWSGCADNASAIGGAGGGKFTNAILDEYDKDRTYNEMWKELSHNGKLSSYQKIKRTELGIAFGGKKVFK